MVHQGHDRPMPLEEDPSRPFDDSPPPPRTPSGFPEVAGLLINGVMLGEALGADPAGVAPPRALAAREVNVGFCHVCGERSAFYGYEPLDFACKRNSFICQSCGASARNRHVAKCVLQSLPTVPPTASLRAFADVFAGRVWAACTTGAIAAAFAKSQTFVGTEYLEGVSSGDVRDGVRCEDLQASSFADESFDLVITEDVLEHVADPARAFAEIRRVLRPGGWHIGTVPVNWARATTVARAVLRDGVVHHLMEPEFHGDALRPEGVLAFTEFGDDIVDAWFARIGPSRVDVAHNDLAQELAFAIYDSWVFLSRKVS
jgi:hypothetical protein